MSKAEIVDIAVCYDDSLLVSCAADKTIRVFEIRTKKQMGSARHLLYCFSERIEN